MPYFQDARDREIQYELVEACEAYPDEVEYLQIFGKNVRRILNRAPEWGGLMLQSILNTPSCCEVLYQVASERKESLTDLWSWIAAIAENEPKYKHILAKINERMRPTSGDSGLR